MAVIKINTWRGNVDVAAAVKRMDLMKLKF
jgi:hypothetical protein